MTVFPNRPKHTEPGYVGTGSGTWNDDRDGAQREETPFGENLRGVVLVGWLVFG